MGDLLRAVSISGGILLAVVVFVVIVSMVAVKRGEANMHQGGHDGHGHGGGKH